MRRVTGARGALGAPADLRRIRAVRFTATTVALAYATPAPYVRRAHGSSRRGQVDADRSTDHRGAGARNGRRRRTLRSDRRALRRSDVAVLRRRDLGRPHPHAGSRDERARLHPFDGDARTPGRSFARCSRRRARPRRGRISVRVVETVGVGQMEVEIASAADTTIVVTNPGWGDSMQANKAGLLEVADLFVINKADRPGAKETRRDLEQMLDLGRARAWRPSSLRRRRPSGAGIDDLFEAIDAHRRFLDDDVLAESRRRRARIELDKVGERPSALESLRALAGDRRTKRG